MKRRSDQERLLDEVLAEAAGAEASAAALDQLLGLARQRRRGRALRRASATLLVCALAVAMILFRPHPPTPQTELTQSPTFTPSYQLVTSAALPPEQVVVTQPLAAVQMIESSANIAIIQTTGGPPRLVNDEELLQLARPNIAMLVRLNASRTELVLLAASTPGN